MRIFWRGVMRELIRRGHEARSALSPAIPGAGSISSADQGNGAIAAFRKTFPDLRVGIYGSDFEHEAAACEGRHGHRA